MRVSQVFSSCHFHTIIRKFKMLWRIFIIFGLISAINGQSCSSPNITNDQFQYGYNFKQELSLNFTGVIESFLMAGTERIYDTSNNNWPENYIGARFARGVLEVYTTTAFKRYVEEQSSPKINLQVTLVCEDLSRPILIFRIQIKRENLYAPAFSKSVYNLQIPLPLYKGFDLTMFEQISARDIDIFDNKVTFSTNYTGVVEIKTKSEAASDSKTFYAMLILNSALITLRNPLEFYITAMDSGQPPRSASARIRITADETIAFYPPPRFEKSLYIGELTDTLELKVESLVLTFDTWTTDVKFVKEGNDANMFTMAPNNHRIQIALVRNLTEQDIEQRTFFSFVIVASRSDDMVGSCSVIIEIPQKSTEHRFTKLHFNGSLNKFGNLSIEDISYDPEDYAPDIRFNLTSSDAYLFKVSNNEANIRIDFIADIKAVNFQDRRYLFVIISATRDRIAIANSGITITLPPVPKFSQKVYSGQISKSGRLTSDTIRFEGNGVSDIKTVYIRGNNSERFTIKGSRNELQLDLKVPFAENELRSFNLIKFSLIAISRGDIDGSSEFIIDFPGYLEVPVFENAVYKGKIQRNSTLELSDVVLRNNTYTDGVEFELTGDNTEYFQANNTRNVITIQSIKTFSSSFLQNFKYLNLILLARNKDQDSTSTSIILDMPIFIAPEFTKLSYKGTLDRYFQLNIEEISIKRDTYDDGVELSLSGNDAKFFRVKLNSGNVLLEINDEKLNLDEINRRISLDLIIIAENEDGLKGRATVSVEVPASCASGNGTCPPCPTVPSDTCPEVTTPNPASAPLFDRKLYLFRIEPNYRGTIGTLLAKMQGPSVQVKYSLKISNTHLKVRLSLEETSGKLVAHEYVSPGLYTFQAVATNPSTNAKGYAKIRLTVDAAITCPNGTNVVSSSLLVKHIDEEKVHTDLLTTKYGRCVFSIFGMEPNDKAYVSVDNRTNQLTAIAIDREHATFEGMLVPQIVVQLKLNCPISSTNRQRRSLPDVYSAEDDSKSFVLTDDIPFNPMLTTLSLIIDDVNDHSPEFTYPPNDGYVVGYPEVDVYYNLMPEYFMKVEANDRDSGYNAKIRYSLSENDYFEIDSVSGLIYPLAKSSQTLENIELILTATDRDGASDGRKTRIRIVVKLLLSTHLTLLTLSDQTAQDLEMVLKNISESAGGEVYTVRYAMIPSHSVQEDEQKKYERTMVMGRKTNRNTILRAWIYVVDAQGKFVESEDVEKKLENLRDKYHFETARYVANSDDDELFVDTTGLVAGISVLGVLLFAGIGAAFLFWWFWLRPNNFKSISNETTSETMSSDGSVDREMKYKPSNNFYYEDGVTYEATNQLKKRDAVSMAVTTNQDTSDESNSNSLGEYSYASENSESSQGQNERRKSIVTFNELVERIDIEVNVNDTNNFRQHGGNSGDVRL